MQHDAIPVDALIGFGLFALSELIGLSRMRSNTVLQLLLTAAMRAFPYEIQQRQPEQRRLFGKVKGDRRGR